VCGEQGVAPVSSKGNVWITVGQWLFEFLAPLAAGLLLGVNLGVITGAAEPGGVAARRGTLVGPAGSGHRAICGKAGRQHCSLADGFRSHSFGKRDEISSAEPFPNMRSAVRVAFFMAIIALMTIAIATVDALGLHMLYQERLQEGATHGRWRRRASAAVGFFFIAGLIISAPYIVYKAVKGWRELEVRQREARIVYLHWKHVDRRREEPAVQQAFYEGAGGGKPAPAA
jgi:hypothetical protein